MLKGAVRARNFWDGTWMASLFIFVPWITGQVLTQPSRSLLICECSELDGFFVLGASLTAWLADGVLAHDLVTHACRHSALPELWPFAALYRAASHFDSVPVVPKMWSGPSVHASDWERFAA